MKTLSILFTVAFGLMSLQAHAQMTPDETIDFVVAKLNDQYCNGTPGGHFIASAVSLDELANYDFGSEYPKLPGYPDLGLPGVTKALQIQIKAYGDGPTRTILTMPSTTAPEITYSRFNYNPIDHYDKPGRGARDLKDKDSFPLLNITIPSSIVERFDLGGKGDNAICGGPSPYERRPCKEIHTPGTGFTISLSNTGNVISAKYSQLYSFADEGTYPSDGLNMRDTTLQVWDLCH